MQKNYYGPRWYYEPSHGEWRLVKAGEREPQIQIKKEDLKAILEMEEVHLLIAALDEAGWIVPRLDERLREEDLKITHRLLDIIERRARKEPSQD